MGPFECRDTVKRGWTSVNPDKTGLVALTRKRKLPGFFETYFFGVTLSLSVSVKYLRVILNIRLICREHGDEQVEEGIQSVVGL